MIVTIDGPAGAGKSSAARGLAKRLGFDFLDTGAMYRALTWLALQEGVPLDDGPGLRTLATANPVEFGDGGSVSIGGGDVPGRMRAPAIDAAAPRGRRHPWGRAGGTPAGSPAALRHARSSPTLWTCPPPPGWDGGTGRGPRRPGDLSSLSCQGAARPSGARRCIA